MAYCYILFGRQINKYYTGITTEEPQTRLEKHISKHYEGQHFTHAASDWSLFLTIKCNTIDQARKIEKHIKHMKSKKYIENLKEYPEMREKLLNKYS